MTFETDLFLVIKSASPQLVTPSGMGRIYEDFAPARTPRPYCTYQAIGGAVINSIENAAPGKRNTHLQINVWSSTRAEALTIIRAIEDAMRAATAFQARPLAAPIWDFDADVPVYSAIQDFTCWHAA